MQPRHLVVRAADTKRFWLRAALVVVVAVITLAALTLGTSSDSLAANATLTLRPSSAPPGSAVTADGAGFQRDIIIEILLDGSRTGMPTTRSDGSGRFSVVITVPATATAGNHAVAARKAGTNGKLATAT